ncbi:MAG TPA: GntR family transcriptional regulator [Pseudolabrys sp.]
MAKRQLASIKRRRPGPTSAPTGPVSQHVYHTLRQLLITGGFRPGESVSLRTLAKRLGTSAMPVREAVNRLIAEQALQMLPNRQVIVPRMTRRKFFELTRVRQLLEGMAAGSACDNMTDALLSKLESANADMLAALLTAPVAEILRRNKDFHFSLYDTAQSEVLLPMIEGLWMQTGPFQALSLSRQKPLWKGHRHAALLAALRRRNREKVIDAIQGDIEDVAEMLMQIGVFDD